MVKSLPLILASLMLVPASGSAETPFDTSGDARPTPIMILSVKGKYTPQVHSSRAAAILAALSQE